MARARSAGDSSGCWRRDPNARRGVAGAGRVGRRGGGRDGACVRSGQRCRPARAGDAPLGLLRRLPSGLHARGTGGRVSPGDAPLSRSAAGTLSGGGGGPHDRRLPGGQRGLARGGASPERVRDADLRQLQRAGTEPVRGRRVAHLTAFEVLRAVMAPGSSRFAAHVATYPGGSYGVRAEAGAYTGAPILMLLGEKDDNLPVAKVEGYLAYAS